MNSGTPQPSALAALQQLSQRMRQQHEHHKTGVYTHGQPPELSEHWANELDRAIAAWPTQAQGEAVAKVLVFPNGHTRFYWKDELKLAERDQAVWNTGHERTVELVPLYTHPSPSTAALREALTDCVELLESIYKGGPKSWVAERARTLLEGDSREND